MADSEDFSRAVDALLDHHAETVGYLEVEMILQQRAQDMRECAYAKGRDDVILPDDLEGWRS